MQFEIVFAKKENLFVGYFYFTFANVKSIFGRTLLEIHLTWDKNGIYSS